MLLLLMMFSCTSIEIALEEQPSKPLTEEKPTIRLWFGGDMHVATATNQRLEHLIAHLPNTSGIINLEGPITAGPAVTKEEKRWILKNSIDLPDTLRNWGVSVTTFANNHRRDAGLAGENETFSRLKQTGIAFAAEETLARMRLNNQIIAILASDLSEKLTPSLFALLHAERKTADVLIVSYHVSEDTNLPTPRLEQAISTAVEAGADIIVAHGSHRLGPVRRVGGAIVATGLGNLLFDCECTAQQEAMVLEVSIDERGNISAFILPVLAGLNGENARLATDDEGILNFIEALGNTPVERVGWKGSF